MNRLSIDLYQCHGCGLCAGICPTSALSMKIDNGKYIPFFYPEKCINCKKCEKICNGKLQDTNKQKYNSHPYIGQFSECHIGYSTDQIIRRKSASGGLISALLIYLLKTGKIDGVILTKIKYDGQNIETCPFIARTEKDVLSASGSFYLPVNFSNVMKEIQDEKNDDIYAIVALPCVISNLKQAAESLPFLHKKIKYRFGLFCSGNFNYSILDFIKKKANIPSNHNIQYLNFRSKWPEFVLSIHTHGKEYELFPKYWNFLFTLKMYLMSEKCLVCTDCCAESADLSFGDAWLPSIKKIDKIGTSICVSRTKEGNDLLWNAKNENHLYIIPAGPDKVAFSQRFALYFKKVQNPILRKIKYGKNGKETRFIPPLLVTIPIILLLNKFSTKYPSIATKIPYLIYVILFYIVSINVIIGHRYMRVNK